MDKYKYFFEYCYHDEDSAIRPPEAASWPANFLPARGLFLLFVGENWLRVILQRRQNWLQNDKKALDFSRANFGSANRKQNAYTQA